MAVRRTWQPSCSRASPARRLTHVPYKGSGPAVADLVGGRVQIMFDAAPSLIAHIRSGKLRVLGAASVRAQPAAAGSADLCRAGLSARSRCRSGTACSRQRPRRNRSSVGEYRSYQSPRVGRRARQAASAGRRADARHAGSVLVLHAGRDGPLGAGREAGRGETRLEASHDGVIGRSSRAVALAGHSARDPARGRCAPSSTSRVAWSPARATPRCRSSPAGFPRTTHCATPPPRRRTITTTRTSAR